MKNALLLAVCIVQRARELQEHRDTIRQLDARGRDAEEAIKFLAWELRHSRGLESAESEQLILQLERELTKLKQLPAPHGRTKR